MKPLPLLLAMFWVTTVAASPLEQCRAKANGSQEETKCFGEEFSRIDALLEKTFQAQVNGLPKAYEDLTDNREQIQQLQRQAKEAQSKWRSYRESYCRFIGDGILGSGAAAAYVHCNIRLTKQRLDEIGRH